MLNLRLIKIGFKSKEISQTMFAKKIYKSFTNINEYENKRQSSIEDFNKLAVVLKLILSIN